jgi:predicted acylesterase/phospholipase RssA
MLFVQIAELNQRVQHFLLGFYWKLTGHMAVFDEFVEHLGDLAPQAVIDLVIGNRLAVGEGRTLQQVVFDWKI